MTVHYNVSSSPLVSSAPGRADFLNTHQDYKGLPVVPVGLDLRTYVVASGTNRAGCVQVKSIDLKERCEEYSDEFEVGEDLQYAQKGFFGNYLRAVTKVLFLASEKQADRMLRSGFGLRVVIKSEVPLASGLASSAALEVSFAKLLDRIYGLGLGKREIAEACYGAENGELGIPCGRLDQYGSSYGGVIVVECKPPYNVRRIPFSDLCFVVVDSGIRHSTAEIHPARQSQLNTGLKVLMESGSLPEKLKRKLAPNYYKTRWSELTENELTPYLSALDVTSQKRILFTLRMNQSTSIALKIMEARSEISKTLKKAKRIPDLDSCLQIAKKGNAAGRSRVLYALGGVMNYQHLLLRDLYDVSLPEIEKIRDKMLQTETYGVKISGAGLGGSLVALVRNKEHGGRTLSAGLEAGARRGWVSNVGEGARIEDSQNPETKRIVELLSTQFS